MTASSSRRRSCGVDGRVGADAAATGVDRPRRVAVQPRPRTRIVRGGSRRRPRPPTRKMVPHRSWCVAKGAIYMPKSTKRARMLENADVFDLAARLDGDDFARLDRLTTPETITAYKALYEKCVVRDTPLGEDDPGIKRDITAG